MSGNTKIMKDQAVLVLVTTAWQTQVWYPRLLAMSTKRSIAVTKTRMSSLGSGRKPAAGGLESVRHGAAAEGLSGHAASLVVGSWREGAQGFYNKRPCLKRKAAGTCLLVKSCSKPIGVKQIHFTNCMIKKFHQIMHFKMQC